MVNQRDTQIFTSILNGVENGKSLSQIARENNMSKQALNHYARELKRRGFIRKVGYGTWRKEVKTSVVSGQKEVKNSVRGHGFQFKLKLPANFRNWDKREEFLTKKKINFKPYYVAGVKRGQQFKFKEFTIQLTDKHIIMHTKQDFYSSNAQDSKNYALSVFLDRIISLENLLKANFSFNGKYKFKVTRQHYALIKNELAIQYHKEGKKLHVYTDKGLWLIIDNSFNLHELETIQKETADADNLKVQKWFNGLKKYDGFTPEFLMKALGGVTANQQIYANNVKTHISAIKQLAENVNILTEKIEEFSKHVKKK